MWLRGCEPFLLLQVGDLQYASPATVSRCGMVYVDPKNLKYKPYWKKWLQQIQNKVKSLLTSASSLALVAGWARIAPEGVTEGHDLDWDLWFIVLGTSCFQ